jgi:hypothetical protein
MKYNFFTALIIIILLFSFCTYFIIANYSPNWYMELLMLFSLWAALLSLFAFIFYFSGFLFLKFKHFLRNTAHKKADRTEKMIQEGQLKLYLSRRTFRANLMKGYLVATAIIILILLQRFFGFI